MQHLLDSIKYNKDHRFPREELEEIISKRGGHSPSAGDYT